MRFTLLVAVLGFAAGASATTLYTQRTSFESNFVTSLTDTYSPTEGYPAGITIRTDAAMSAVFGETVYTATGFANLNIVTNGSYCAGCNGSFRLTFTQTSIGTAQGVYGVGMDIESNSGYPYFAFITFGDNSTTSIPIPGGNSFFGIVDPIRIKSIHFGLAGGGATTTGAFAIDNLTIGSVPEPSLALPVAGALGLWGLRAYRRRHAARG